MLASLIEQVRVLRRLLLRLTLLVMCARVCVWLCERVQAKSTRVLHLSYMGLERVPAQVWTLTDLIRLDLGHNDIRELHPDIGKLTALEELWLNSASGCVFVVGALTVVGGGDGVVE
jgi:Leucine-rich repeat (LRR) protein